MNQPAIAETMSPPVVPRRAATLVVVRDAPAGLEVLLLRRAEKGDHNSGAWVFPGGLLDAADRRCHAACSGIDDAIASERLGVAEGGLDYYIAAVRECFEEAGLLFAVDAHDRMVAIHGETGARLQALRSELHGGACEFADLCRDFGLRVAADRLFYIAHWVTPVGRAKRFDTRFFLAVLPRGQRSRHDAVETLDQAWLTPAEALAPENSRKLMTPTRSVIATISRFADTDSLLAWARSPREVATVLPRLGMDRHGLRPVQQHDPAWAEVGHLQAQGHGIAWCEIRPGVPVRLSPRVLRVSAAGQNGWNSYLIGAADAWTVLDPGPADEEHLAALLAAAPGPIRHIVLTQPDASPAAQALAERTGAQLRQHAHGPLALPGDTTLDMVRHPALEPSIACYLLVQERTLFTGSLAAADLATLAAGDHRVAWIAPAHGFLVPASKSR
jgi:8-oxo-dGTP pyrophosphatase MutT (NUDIX family)